MTVPWKLVCVDTGTEYPGDELRYRSDSGGTLDVMHDFTQLPDLVGPTLFDTRLGSLDPLDQSGVWRFRELILPLDDDQIVTRMEGRTNLYDSPTIAMYVGLESMPLKHEGENPTGSFKDRGMTTGVTMAHHLGMERVACASTGNTSASMASYAALAGMEAFVFIPEGNIAYGKLSQALAYGARTIQVSGNFDDAMRLVEKICRDHGVYLLNSLNPFRLEGQKAVGFELLQDLGWETPDWIVLPGGNLGNNSAIFKGLAEMYALGMIKEFPRLAIIQAEGASPLYRAFQDKSETVTPQKSPETIATAIRIGSPVSWKKSMRAIRESDGVVEMVTDQQIMDAKAIVDGAGIGAEPASCATVAGAKKLVEAGVIKKNERVVGVLTGHLLKDPDATTKYHLNTLEGIRPRFANPPITCSAEPADVLKAMNLGR